MRLPVPAAVSSAFHFRYGYTSCSAEVWRHVGIAFAGVTPAEDPHVFLASGEWVMVRNRPRIV